MDIFNYHPISKEYLSTEVAELDPLEGLPLIPAHATTVVVITPSAGSVAIFDGTVWSEIEDNRGYIYDTTSKEQFDQVELGVLAADKTSLVPTSTDMWDGSAWITDLTLVKQDQKNVILASFDAALAAGFTTTSTTKMNATNDDVLQLDGGVRLAEAMVQTDINIRDYNNVVSTITVVNAKTMVNELGTNYQTLLNNKWTLQDQIDVATTQAAVEAIVWV